MLNQNFKGKDELIDEMCSERESVQAFMNNSFGIVAFHEQELAGWCLSEYNDKNHCEVGIATMQKFRCLGLAKAMTYSFLHQAYNQGIDTALWHCAKSNISSSKTAISCNFSLY